MQIRDDILLQEEKTLFALRSLYLDHGYAPFRMSKFEEYDLYARNKDFLVSDNVITFTDTDGKLMALKPDVTLSIIKNSRDLPDETRKVFYNENVYRISGSTRAFREILQAGVECFGRVQSADEAEVVRLAARSLLTISPKTVLSIGNLALLESAFDAAEIPEDSRDTMRHAVSTRNPHEAEAACGGADLTVLNKLLAVSGTPAQAIPELAALRGELPGDVLDPFLDVLRLFEADEAASIIRVDLTVSDDVHYYSGMVFKGWLDGVPEAVLSGGRYDRLMRKLGRRSSAIGFAVYMDELEYADPAAADPTEDSWLNVALPKGRLGEKVYALFARAGLECPSILENNRKLIFENPEKRVRYFWVKPSDVAIYVERGAADLGVAGKDILLEYEPDVLELLDLGLGKCRMAVAGPAGFKAQPSRTLRVATKFSHIAREYYAGLGRDIDIIHLNGSIEIAPILGLSDVIVDIVETGTTLRENNLEVLETVVPISARLIANKSAYRFKGTAMNHAAKALAAALEEK